MDVQLAEQEAPVVSEDVAPEQQLLALYELHESVQRVVKKVDSWKAA